MCSFGVTNICIFSTNLVKHKKVRLNRTLEIDLLTDGGSSSYAFNESYIYSKSLMEALFFASITNGDLTGAGHRVKQHCVFEKRKWK